MVRGDAESSSYLWMSGKHHRASYKKLPRTEGHLFSWDFSKTKQPLWFENGSHLNVQVTGSGGQLLSRTTKNPFRNVTVKHLLPVEKQRQSGIPKRQCIHQNLLGKALGILYQKFQPKERGNEETGNLKVHRRSPEWPPSHLAA